MGLISVMTDCFSIPLSIVDLRKTSKYMCREEQFMPRPVKCRKVCHFPNVLEFFPADDAEKKTPIVLTVDEYETIRLLDKKGYSQEQCAASMQVARTTVQRIYEIARKKIADALIDGYPLKIEGGDFKICDGQSSNCGLGGCYKQELHQKYAAEKGEGIMRIAEYSRAMKSHFRKFGNQMSGSGNHLCNYASLLA